MKWMDDLTGAQLPRRRLTLQLALYAMHLGNGGTLLCCTIKAGTIAKYLQAVGNFLQCLHPEQINPRRVHDADKQLAPPIKAVLTELERWETVPNRREPYTLQMQATLQTWTVGMDNDSYYSACVDWFLLGLYLGLWCSEWAQSHTNYQLGSHQMNHLPTPQPQAFLLGDFEFRDISQSTRVACAISSSRFGHRRAARTASSALSQPSGTRNRASSMLSQPGSPSSADTIGTWATSSTMTPHWRFIAQAAQCPST
jgi:hypothetical protein